MKNFIALLIFAAGGTAWYFYHQYSEAKALNADYAKNLAVQEQGVAARRAEIQAYAQLLDLQNKVQAKKAEVNEVVASDKKLQEELNRLRKEKVAIILAARQSYMGQTLPELVLADGRKLQTVRVLKVDDSGLSVIVPSGVQKISPEELPEELRHRLHYSQ
ncbi:hypothetical protein WJU23_09380 [Prosthecobacter sp. SYSU 5D2]|uniref:hypothetical protein n=1 Tax=Prosthecobacter sp. SYSU 5D2 TaxID=3134134 RepID=UPI0031FE84C5